MQEIPSSIQLLKRLLEALDQAPPPAQVEPHYDFDSEVTAACLVREAAGERDPNAGMTAVMNVIVNRARAQGKTCSQICLAPHQFSGMSASAVGPAKQSPMWQVALRIVQLAKAGRLPDITHGATHYYSPWSRKSKTPPQWVRAMVQTAKIGHHIFYKQV